MRKIIPVIGVIVTILFTLVPRPVSALPPEEAAAVTACEAGSQGLPEQFNLIKRFSTGGWAAIFGLDHRIPMFCGQNLPGYSNHGYLHIRDRHRGDWETVRSRILDIYGPHPALASWIDVVDPALKATLVGPAEVTTDKTECRTGIIVVLNSSGGAYYRGYRTIVQRGGGVYPENAVGTTYPISTDCQNNPIVYPDARGREADSRIPQVRVECDAVACSYTVNSDNAFVKPAGGAAYFVGGPLKKKWEGARASLPAPTSDTTCKLVDKGCAVDFDGSSIYYTNSTGAQIIAGRIRAKWSSLGAERSSLGYPTSSEKCGLARKGCFSHFQGGSSAHVPGSSIHYSPATGAWVTRGLIRDAWIQTASERGHWGYPVSDEYRPPGRPASHRIQDFEFGFFYFDGTAVTGEWGDPGCPSCRRHTVRFPS